MAETGYHTPSSGSQLRPLAIRYGALEHSLLIPSSQYVLGTQVRDALFLSLPSAADENSIPEQPQNELDLVARFLGQATQFASTEAGAYDEFLSSILTEFERSFLKGNEIHAVTAKQSQDLANTKVIIKSYYAARLALGKSIKGHDSAIIRATQNGVRLFAIFGGQGNLEEYFDELRELVDVYDGLVSDFVTEMSELLNRLIMHKTAQPHFGKGLDILSWLHDPLKTPDLEYMITAPVSFPLIGLIQLTHYLLTLRVLGKSPGTFSDALRGVTGHSQGIVTAVCIAASHSMEDFFHNAKVAIELLFWIGCRSQQVYPRTTLPPIALQDSLSAGEGQPSPMLSVRDIDHNVLSQQINLTNEHLPQHKKVVIALYNGPRNFVVTGPPQSLHGLNLGLRKIKASAADNYGRVPFSKRKLKFVNRFLPISAPFHSDYLVDAAATLRADCAHLRFGQQTRIPVYCTNTGKDLSDIRHTELIDTLIDLITTKQVYWQKATMFSTATHIIDFGLGGSSGVGGLTHRIKEGTGVRVILGNVFSSSSAELGAKVELFDREDDAVQYAVNWQTKYSPKLVKTANGKVFVDTAFSRLLGKPPVMVAGMTPCTVSTDFVAATMNAGYHIELAGGGYYSADAFTRAIEKLQDSTTPGSGITANIIYINPRTYSWQTPLMKTLRDRGLAVEGLTIAAGVPSIEVANDLCQNLGMKHISFKPGSYDAIQQVISIAKANPTFPIILQWTGGRAGGHHSFEDFHSPILSAYAAIRRCDNIILVAGSGFGGADDTIQYLTGQWATKYDSPCMPFDGILLASRVMTALECKTSLAAKQAIVDAPGLDDHEWEKTYSGPAGGVVTVKSELGEPIHKLATRGILFWKEMDDTVFSLPKDKRLQVLRQKKDYIIGKLNKDFQKVWFGQSAAGHACDLEDMTYEGVVKRMIELMYVKHERRWIDITHRNLVADFIRRIEERFTIADGQLSSLQNFSQLNDPFESVNEIFARYPAALQQLMNTQDVQYFLILCQRRGQKPVPFIPILDDQFEVWFKKDSLWQSEDIEAVVGQDVGRVAILQGPMAAKHSTKVNQPIQEILDNIHDKHIQTLLSQTYGGLESSIPFMEYFGGSHARNIDARLNKLVDQKAPKISFAFPPASSGETLPSRDDWLQLLAGQDFSWKRALLTSDIVVQGSLQQPNPMRRLFAPRHNTRFVIENVNDVAHSTITLSELHKDHYIDVIKASCKGREISVDLYEFRNARRSPVALPLKYTYHPETGYAPIRELMHDRNNRIKRFYWSLWFGDELPTDISNANPETMEFNGDTTTITGEAIESFCHVIGNESEAYTKQTNGKRQAPMDFAIVLGWKAVIKAIFPSVIDGDLLKLVHLSNGFRQYAGAGPLMEGDVISTKAVVTAVRNSSSGKVVEVEGTITRDNKPVMVVLSKFLYRGVFDDFSNTFEKSAEVPIQLTLSTNRDVEVLRSKEWFQPFDSERSLLGSTLTFRLNSCVRFKSETIFSQISTTGAVLLELPTKEIVQIASVEYEAAQSFGNPVIDYLSRHGKPIEQPVYFEDGGYSVIQIPEDIYSSSSMTPPSNGPYAEVSNDYNPIHVAATFSAYVDLPGSSGITHGMYTSASTRKFVETFAAENVPTRVTSYEVTFLDMVLPNTNLRTKLSHIGMVNGKKIIKIETTNEETGAKVLTGTAEVEQPISAYVFTGQGSQEQGMGMELYASSPVAKDVWDRADKHFLDNYGFSILNIVRNNPKELTIHFGGPRGKRIKENYTSMIYEVVDDNGNNISKPIFKDITEASTFYTFISPTGLLSSTQFTQPALTLMEKAAFDDMKAKGLVQANAAFGGHSLGEYSALAAIANVIPIEALVDVVFYRGMTMQVAVPRDAAGRSDYAMMAVNPSRIGRTFNDSALRYVVEQVAARSECLVEIVNFNVENQQYIAAGSLLGLDTLSNVLNYLKAQKIELDRLMVQMSLDDLQARLTAIVDECKKISLDKSRASNGRVELTRGYATIPLKGIDVPFHSTFLRNGVKPFRSFLSRKIPKVQIDPSLLVGAYIPNVTAKPFALSKEYITEAYELTGSPKLRGILENWDQLQSATA